MELHLIEGVAKGGRIQDIFCVSVIMALIGWVYEYTTIYGDGIALGWIEYTELMTSGPVPRKPLPANGS